METITDTELVENVKEKSCNNSLKELILRHSALCVDIYKKYTPALCASGVPIQDVYQDKDYIVYKSALSFKPEKNVKFGSDYYLGLKKYYGNDRDALVAYNYGPGNANKWLKEGGNEKLLPVETQNYLKKILD